VEQYSGSARDHPPLIIGAWSLAIYPAIGHWDLVIGHLPVIGHWGLSFLCEPTSPDVCLLEIRGGAIANGPIFYGYLALAGHRSHLYQPLENDQ
jgi:hypothetical protein